jgi:hypothetical protein
MRTIIRPHLGQAPDVSKCFARGSCVSLSETGTVIA